VGTQPVLVKEQLSGTLHQAITALAWSADGELLAIASGGGELVLLDFRAGWEELLRGDCDLSLDAVGFSSDGQFLMAVGQAGALLLWELGGSGVRPLALEPLPLGAGWLDEAAWQPRGLLLAVAAGRQVRLWDGASRRWCAQALTLPGAVQALAWSSCGEVLAASCNGELALWQPQASPPVAPLRQPTASAGLALAFAPKAGLLAAGQFDRSLLLWPDRGQGTPWQFSGFPAKVRQLAWGNQRGRLAPPLATASAESVVLWSQLDRGPRGWRPEPLRWHGSRVNALAFAPGATLLASASSDGSVALWDGAGRLCQPLEGDGQGFNVLAWRPDGRHLVVGGDRGRWWLWPVALPAGDRPRAARGGGGGFG
jgi:WD40 repeat protein